MMKPVMLTGGPERDLLIATDEKESSEKEGKGKKTSQLSAEKWNTVYKALQPFIRPYGEAKEGKLYFYHRILSKGVRQRLVKIWVFWRNCVDFTWSLI